MIKYIAELGINPYYIISMITNSIRHFSFITSALANGRDESSTSFFSWHHMVYRYIVSCECAGRIWVLAGFITAAQSIMSEFGFWLGTGKALWG